MKPSVFKRVSINLAMMFFLTVIMLVSVMIVGGLLYLLRSAGLFDIVEMTGKHRIIPIFGVLLANFIIVTALTALFGKKVLRRTRELINATHQVAQGNFRVQVDEGKGFTEFSEFAHSFNKMTQELASIETLRSDFINNFSHEFKTPIVSIRGFAKLLKEGNITDEERQEYLDIILIESKRLATLSSNVLALSKYESLEIVTEKTTFRADEQIRRAVLMTEPKWSAKDLDIDVMLEEISYNGNENLTQQIWLNLIDNAAKFSNKGGTLTVRLMRRDNGLFFSIQDTGVGMDEATVSHIFDKFYQGDASRAKEGNGLGLAITKRIVALCGGQISVRSEVGAGSEFHVWLPIA